MLLDWAEANRAAPYTVHIVGESWSGRAYELREALQQCAIPHHFCLADSAEGRALVAAAGDGVELPIMVFPNGDGPGEPHQRRDRGGRRGTGQPGTHGVRRRHRRRRTGGPVGRRVRRLGGVEHPGGRPGRHRRPGDLQLAHPQLPRLPSRRQRPASRPRGLRPGLGLRRAVRLHADGHRPRPRGRPAPRHAVRRRPGPDHGRAPRDGRQLPPARRSVTRGA